MISMPMCKQDMFDVATRNSISSQLGKKRWRGINEYAIVYKCQGMHPSTW